ncbi:DUF2203 family protein [Micromonospora chalcea]
MRVDGVEVAATLGVRVTYWPGVHSRPGASRGCHVAAARRRTAPAAGDLADHGVSASVGSPRCCSTSPVGATAGRCCGAGWRGDTDIRWYHRVECGFAGRRPV